jgi:hypothetical protein
MAVPLVVSSQVPSGETTKRYYDLLAQRPLRIPRIVGAGDARILFSTDAITSGSVGNLTTLFATQIAAGLALFPAGTMTMVRIRAYGRGAAATIFQSCELVACVMMNTTTPVVTNATPVNVINQGGGTAATILLGLSGNDVIINFTGSATVMNWVMDVNIEDPVGVVAGS